MAELHVLKVFVDEDGAGGNPLGVFLCGSAIPDDRRQDVALDLNFSETVFVDDLETASIRIYTPHAEIAFAGHPTVGTAWLLASLGAATESLRIPPGEVGVRFDGDRTFVSARPQWCGPFRYEQLASPAEVDATGQPADGVDTYSWAWIDAGEGTVRARGMYPQHGIAEDEATGSAALELSARLGRSIEVRQGVGSLLHARPLDGGWAEVGGRTELVDTREYDLGAD